MNRTKNVLVAVTRNTKSAVKWILKNTNTNKTAAPEGHSRKQTKIKPTLKYHFFYYVHDAVFQAEIFLDNILLDWGQLIK